jgi:hypothetical protein
MRRALLLLPVILLATVCQATGMGWIPSALDPSEKATFGFVFDGTTQTFSGSYHDHGCGVTFCNVTFRGTGVMKAKPPPDGMKIKGDCIGGEPTYESRDQANPGVGTLTLLLCDADGSGGMGGEDFVAIIVTSGPYCPLGVPPFCYQNSGSPSGNVTVTKP